jgi:hypothetical protein
LLNGISTLLFSVLFSLVHPWAFDSILNGI